jgi:hypothetical protein
MKYCKILIFSLLFTSSAIFSQQRPFSWGIQLGLGSISGNFLSFTSLNPAVFTDISFPFTRPVYYKLKIGFHRNAEFFLAGGARNKYFPYILNFNLDACYEYNADKDVIVAQGAGPLILSDRAFIGIKETDIGVNFFVEVKIKTTTNPEGSYFGGGFEFGNTFTNTTVNYTNFYLKYQF